MHIWCMYIYICMYQIECFQFWHRPKRYTLSAFRDVWPSCATWSDRCKPRWWNMCIINVYILHMRREGVSICISVWMIHRCVYIHIFKCIHIDTNADMDANRNMWTCTFIPTHGPSWPAGADPAGYGRGCLHTCKYILYHICIYIYMYVIRIYYMYIYIYVHLCIDMYAYKYTCICMCRWWVRRNDRWSARLWNYGWQRLWVSICTRMCLYIYIYVYLFLYTYICICIYICICKHIIRT